MKSYKLFIVIFISAILSGTAFTFYQGQKSTPKIILPSEIKFAVSPNDPLALQTVILDGDPAKLGLYSTRVKIPANVKLLAHIHPETRNVVVLSGTFYYGYGDKFDETKLKEMPAGTFFTEPAKQPHFAWTKNGEVILQVTGVGPTGKTDLQ
jgi:hypothetical protein